MEDYFISVCKKSSMFGDKKKSVWGMEIHFC